LFLVLVAAGADELLPIPDSLQSFANLVMSGTATREAIAEASGTASASIAGLDDETARLVYEAQRLFLTAIAARGFELSGDAKLDEADSLLTQAAEKARAANRIRPTSEGFRVLADCLNQLLDIRGIAYKMFNTGPARNAAERAVMLDDRNTFAHVSAAAFYLSVPRAVGGNPETARDHLERALETSGGTPFEEFLVNLWVFRYESEYGSAERAEAAYDAAARIYPENWLLEVAATE